MEQRRARSSDATRATSPPSVSVAILTWNRSALLKRALDSVLRQTFRPAEIVVVDSNSSDDTLTMLASDFPGVRAIALERNLGCPAGRNVAFRSCQGDIVVSLDDDAYLEPDTLEVLVAAMQETGAAVIACNVLDPADPAEIISRRVRTNAFNGGAFAITRAAIESAGLFPDHYFLQGEETDLAMRIVEKGFEILYVPEAIVRHVRLYGTGSHVDRLFYATRNDLSTVIRRVPLLLLPALCGWKTVRWNWSGVRQGGLVYTLRGLGAALIWMPRSFAQRSPMSFRSYWRYVWLRRGRSTADRAPEK